ncbi:hypothetical protein PIB30_081035 [Stylosanthes scabra]|uniref:Uncharacterized protein n=1 Tax=Stylosanthes scabra TaxID=79078 RepID=A0ABU6UQD8_9FABA|nr:hypothetical protein [Stylosanthes scabra]
MVLFLELKLGLILLGAGEVSLKKGKSWKRVYFGGWVQAEMLEFKRILGAWIVPLIQSIFNSDIATAIINTTIHEEEDSLTCYFEKFGKYSVASGYSIAYQFYHPPLQYLPENCRIKQLWTSIWKLNCRYMDREPLPLTNFPDFALEVVDDSVRFPLSQIRKARNSLLFENNRKSSSLVDEEARRAMELQWRFL